MVVGEVAQSTDLLVLGGGPGGYAVALRAAALGLDVTLVERESLGGTCLHVGCIPSKLLIHAAETVAGLKAGEAWGLSSGASVDMARFQEHAASVIAGLAGGVRSLLASAGVKVVAGTGRFTRPDRVAVESADAVRHFEFRHAVVATGSRPLELADLPFDGERVLSSTGALGLRRIPERMVVVGGGYIGVELGTAWAKLGTQVTLVESESRLLPLLDEAFGRVVERRLLELGVDVRTRSLAVEQTEAGILVRSGANEERIVAETVVVAIGRRPNTDGVGLEAAGVRLDSSGRLLVDASLRATKRVFGLGDVTPGAALAHKATAEAEVVARVATGAAATFDPACIPEVVFSDPEIVSVGLRFSEAEEQGLAPRRGRFPLSASARAATLGATAGMVEVIADAEGSIVGVHIAGPGASELAGEAALAVEMAATLEDLALTIHPHPTVSEGLPEAAWAALGLPLHVAGLRQV